MATSDPDSKQVIKPIPEPTLRRLPVYYQYLKKLHEEKAPESVSSTQIGKDLNILPIQVRKDLEVTDVVGRPKLGYDVVELLHRIESFLGWDNTTEGFLVGVGRLGSALLNYEGFRDCGLDIVAAFDSNQSKVGTEVNGTKVLHVNKLPNMIRRTGTRIGILTVPSTAAQELADIMVKAGICAIWNFSPVKISVPPQVIVQHENLASSLVVLSKKLTEYLRTHA